LDKDSKTRSSRWDFFLICVFPSRPFQLYACFLWYFPLVFSWQAEPLKEKPKDRQRLNQQPRAKAAEAEVVAVEAACKPKPGT
jgi:hypothetical protein